MDKRFIVILIIMVLGLGGLFWFTRGKNNATTVTNASVSNHTEGQNAKHVQLLVYGDFECSACEQFYPIEHQVVQKYLSDISFTFRHFPLESLHPNARAASRAAEAAGLQGKFFEMHDLLYENQDSWASLSNPQTVFDQLATSLGLDSTKFNSDFSSQTVNATINADYQEGTSKGVDSTPTYFLNGKELNLQDIEVLEQSNGQTQVNIKLSVDKLSAKIDEAIKAVSKSAQ